MDVETMEVIILASNLIDSKMERIYEINKKLTLMEQRTNRKVINFRWCQNLNANIKKLQQEKDCLIDQIIELRKNAATTMFKTSSSYIDIDGNRKSEDYCDYPYIDDRSEFNLYLNTSSQHQKTKGIGTRKIKHMKESRLA